VLLPEFMRTTTFRWTLVVAGAFAVGIILMSIFALAQAYSYMTSDVDGLIEGVANTIIARGPQHRIDAIDEHLGIDPHQVKIAGLFAPDGSRIAGNVQVLPHGLRVDAGPQLVSLVRIDAAGGEQTVRAIARRLPEGGTLVIGRRDYEFTWVTRIVERALAVGLVPAICLGVAAGAFLSIRAQRRIEQVNSKVQRIVAGELRERLPTSGTHDPFDRLAVLVNGMLDQIEALVRSIAGVGDDIAHDLRTPLTRLRVCLERGRQKAGTLDELRATVDQAIVGDRDLLFEAIANLVDNAVKFTPEGGRVDVSLLRRGHEAVVRVCDTGPGIALGEQGLVARRFYRSDQSRRDPGLGLGLSLVSAIVKLHGFRFSISPGPGCVAEIAGQRASA